MNTPLETQNPTRKGSRRTKTNPTNPTRKGGQERESTKKNKTAMLKALKSCMGIVAGACDKAGIDRSTHYRWMNEDPEYAASAEVINDLVLDFSESALFKLIKAGNLQAVIFHLKTKGKARGYTERQEIEHRGIEIPIVRFHVPEELKKIAPAPLEKQEETADASSSKRKSLT